VFIVVLAAMLVPVMLRVLCVVLLLPLLLLAFIGRRSVVLSAE